MGAEVVQGDLLDRESLHRASAGIGQIVASAHAALSRGKYSPLTVDGQGHRDLIEVAREVGVQHFVYVSAIGVSADNPIDFFRIKHGTEETLKSSGLPYSIVRGAAFMETQIELNAPQLLQKQKALVFGRGDKRSNFVSVVDVARFVVLALQDARLLNRTITVGGPENLTRNQVLDLYEYIMDTKIKRSRMPVPLLRLLSLVVGPFHPVARRMFKMGIAMGTKEQTVDMQELLAEFPMELTRLESVIEAWHRSLRRQAARDERSSDHHGRCIENGCRA